MANSAIFSIARLPLNLLSIEPWRAAMEFVSFKLNHFKSGTLAPVGDGHLVVTIGALFNAEADHTNVGWLYRMLSGESAAIAPAMAKRLRTPPPLPTTSIYSRSDGVGP